MKAGGSSSFEEGKFEKFFILNVIEIGSKANDISEIFYVTLSLHA